MKLHYNISLILLFISISSSAYCGDTYTISIESHDEIIISADMYFIDDNAKAPIIVLFHQAGWSRGEYKEIAPKLNTLGFNSLAVDLRSGDKVNGVSNKTASLAKASNKETRYIDALPDMIATLKFVAQKHPDNTVIAWGSSYSAALVLHIAGTHPNLLDGVLSFAPGEYFSKQGKSNKWIQQSASSINVPVFITSARAEKNNWSAIFDAIPSSSKDSFIPESKGNHGSRALWKEFSDHDAYWTATTNFLNSYFPR